MFPIFKKLGGEEAVLQILQNARSTSDGRSFPGKAALKKWKSEGRIPPINAEILERECDRRGVEWSRNDFRRDGHPA